MRLSIKIKWTIFITLLLAVSIFCTGFAMLKGVKTNQKSYYENLLLENSKIANLYIRENYESSDYDDFSLFYKKESDHLAITLNKMFHMPLILYDVEGKVLSSGENIIYDSKPLDIMKEAMEDKIIYEKLDDKIIFLAPVYDYDAQIGILRITYSTERENQLYGRLRVLFFKVGLLFISIAGSIGIYYFSKITKNISNLKRQVGLIEVGNYNVMKCIESNDELEDLNNGIILMSEKIKQNVDELTKEKDKLKLVINKLQKLEKQQKEFIGNITHEFKTPLTVIKSQIDLITMYMDDRTMVEKAKVIADKELMRMDYMIQNILHLSKVEKYDFDFKKESVDTKEILEEICNRMEAKARKFGISIIKELENIEIIIDKKSFMQIFINLIDNAIKYNRNQGKIYVRCYKEGENSIIEIEDTGIGIPEEFRDRIFEPFFTVDKNRSKQFSGTGLGLSLVHKLIESQNGSIKLVKYKEGAKFRITFKGNDLKLAEQGS